MTQSCPPSRTIHRMFSNDSNQLGANLMKRQIFTLFLLASLFCAPLLHASERQVDMSYLSVNTLPPPRMVVEASLDALPRALSELQEFERRIRLSAMAPRVEVRYQQRQSAARRFDHVERITTRSTHSENISQTDQSRLSADPEDTFVRDSSSDRFSSTSFTERNPRTALQLDDEEVTRHSIELRAVWRLDDLVFHPAELRTTQANRTAARHRVRQIETVVPMYRAFINAVRRLEEDPTNRQARETVADRLVVLDIMTDNFVSRYAKARYAELERQSAPLARGAM